MARADEGASIPGSASPGAVEQVLAQASRDTVPLAALVLGCLHVAFIGVDYFAASDANRWPLVTVDVVLGALFFGILAAAKRKPIPLPYAHAALAGVTGLALVNIGITLSLVAEPPQTLYSMVLAIGAGAVFLSMRWLAILLSAILAVWLTAAVHDPMAWTFYGIALLCSFALSILVQSLRLRSARRMEVMRMREGMRSREMEARQQALEEAMRAVAESEERYRLLVEHAPDAMMVNSEGRWVYVNQAALRLFGAKHEDELLGTSVIERVHPEDREVVSARVHQTEHEGRATPRREIRALRLDGQVIHIEVGGIPVMWNGKPADHSIVRDITERREAEEGRALAAERLAEISRLQEMDRMRTRFLNTVSHELRTPLTPIKVQLHLLKLTAHDEQQSRVVEVLERNVVRLNSLLDELLDVARVQSGAMSLTRKPEDVGRVVREALESFEDVARLGRVRLDSRLDGDLAAEVDAQRIGQVLFNLCGNAFKFTPAGGRIHVSACRKDDQVVVRVEDTGAGLAPEDAAKLFEPFSQVHDTSEQTRAGTGLGLYICRGIVEGHGGRIWCESSGKGKGSTFAFSLPVKAPAPEAPTPQAA